MTAIFLAVILIVGYHFESQHPLRRLKLVRQTGYNLYFRIGYTGFQMASYELLPSLLMVYITAIINGVAGKALFTNKTYAAFFSTTFMLYMMLFAVMVMKARLMSLQRRFEGVTVNGYAMFDENKPSAEKQAIYQSLLDVATDREQLIIEAARDVIPLRGILSSGKVYIGWPQHPDLDNGEITQLKLLPILSSFLTDEQKMVISRNYYKHYTHCYDENGELLDVEDDEAGHDHISRFCIILGIDDIKVMSLFSKVAFDAIENQKVD